MSNNSHHFKFTKKENTLNNSINENRKNNIQKERKNSELLIEILNSNTPFNNKINCEKSKTIDNDEKISLFNKKDVNFRGRRNLKVEVINNLTKISTKNKINAYKDNNLINMNNKIINHIIEMKKTEENKKTRIKTQNLHDIKTKYKHNLNMNLENKFSFLKKSIINNTINNVHITDSNRNKNKINQNNNLNYIMKNRKKIQYRLKNTAVSNKYSNFKTNVNTIKNKKNLLKYLTRTKTEESYINNNTLKLNRSVKLREKNNKNNGNSDKKEHNSILKILNESEKINSKINNNLEKNPHSIISKINSKIKNNQKKETLYFNFDKNNISLTKKEEHKNQDFNLDNNDNDIVEFKRKKLIMLNDFDSNEIIKHNKNVLHSPPKKLLDTIRTIRKLSKIEKV